MLRNAQYLKLPIYALGVFISCLSATLGTASEDIADQYAKANIVCLPSYREGFPKVLIEAAACGRAVVTTDVAGCRDAIYNGVTGVLVSSRDTNGLADAIFDLIGCPETYLKMGIEGRKMAEERATKRFKSPKVNKI